MVGIQVSPCHGRRLDILIIALDRDPTVTVHVLCIVPLENKENTVKVDISSDLYYLPPLNPNYQQRRGSPHHTGCVHRQPQLPRRAMGLFLGNAKPSHQCRVLGFLFCCDISI